MNKLIFSAFFCLVVLIWSAGEIFACTCVKPKPVEAVYEQHSAIFSGKVTSVKTVENIRRVKIRVEKLWKGNLPKTITFSTMAVGSMCGYNFAFGKRYLIYASGENMNELSTSICTRTGLLSKSKEDVETLNKLGAKDDSKTKSSPK